MVLKYKQLNKIKDITRIPQRVSKFKRPKWNKLKSILNSKVSKGLSSSIYSSTDTIVTASFWNKLSKSYKEKLYSKRKYFYVFGTKLNDNATKNKLNYLSFSAFPFYSPLFLLSLYGFTASKRHSKYYFLKGQISLNNSNLKNGNLVLKAGDMLLLKETINLSINYDKYNFFPLNMTYVEMDPYSQQTILLKNVSQIGEEDIESVNFENIKFF